MMMTMMRTICLARPSIGSRLMRYKTRMMTRNVTSTLINSEAVMTYPVLWNADPKRAAGQEVPLRELKECQALSGETTMIRFTVALLVFAASPAWANDLAKDLAPTGT